jgi:hypothetical protein
MEIEMYASMKKLAAMAVLSGFALAAGTASAETVIVRDVDAHSSNRYTYRADPGEFVIVNLSGDGDTDLDLIVRDPRGRIVCQSLGRWDEERCTFRDGNGGGRYSIEVKNLGGVYNRFRLQVI